MKVFRSFIIPKTYLNSVIAIGNFDGVHIGHQEVINKAVKVSNKKKVIQEKVKLDQEYRQNSSQIWVLFKTNTKKIPNFSFIPICGRKNRGSTW